MHLLVSELRRFQNARCNDKDVYTGINILMSFKFLNSDKYTNISSLQQYKVN